MEDEFHGLWGESRLPNGVILLLRSYSTYGDLHRRVSRIRPVIYSASADEFQGRQVQTPGPLDCSNRSAPLTHHNFVASLRP